MARENVIQQSSHAVKAATTVEALIVQLPLSLLPFVVVMVAI